MTASGEDVMNTRNRVVLVTGSSRGIGRGIAVELAKKGYDVAVNYAGNKDAGEETVRLCSEAAAENGYQCRFKAFPGDISHGESRKELLKEVINFFGDLHGLVNNAGIAPKERRDILEMEEDACDRLIGTNLKGSF